MSRLTVAKKTWAMCCRLKAQRGGSCLWYFADSLYCSFRHGASPENYFVLRFYRMSDRQRKDFLTSGRSKAADGLLNRKATAEDRRTVARKELFDRKFNELVKRDFLYVPDAGFEEFESFTERHPEFFVKPPSGTMGRGIELLKAAELDKREFYERCRVEGLLLEEPIVQHKELEKLNPDSVNTVRINAARGLDGKIRLIGACLKCGGCGAVTDNFHSGGVAYPIDMEKGQVCGPGRNNSDARDFFRHPGSECYMPGFPLPFWEETKEYAYRGMEKVPSLGYVGWDIAITPQGPELIEGNYSWPGGNIIQFDNVGKYPIILKCLGDRHEKHIVG